MRRWRQALLWSAAQLTRRWKAPGAERIIRKLCAPGQRPSFDFQAPYDGRFRVQGNTASYLEWWVFFFGIYEPEVRRAIADYLKPNQTALDVGSNIGLSALSMAAQVGAQGKVIAIEPHPGLFEKLLKNIQRNGLSQVAPLKCALSGAAGQACLHLPSEQNPNQGLSSLSPAENPELRESIWVETKTLDGLVDELSLKRVDFIKIDTEGTELAVLQGAAGTLCRFYPTLIFSYNPLQWKAAGCSFDQARQLLQTLGYRMTQATDRANRPLTRAPEKDSNLLALPAARQRRPW